MSLLQGVQIRASQEFGAKRFANCGKIYLQGKRYAWLLGFLFMLIGLNGQQILLLCGQSEAMAENSGRLLMILALSIPGIMQFENANFFLQSIRRQHVAVYASVIANLLNIILNYALVYGHWGFPEWGAAGSAMTTLTVRTFLGVFMLGYVQRMKVSSKLCHRFDLNLPVEKWWQNSRDVRQLGWWIAVTCLALNGRGDVQIPRAIQAFSFLIVRLSAAYWFTFSLRMGIRGLYWGMICGGISSLLLHFWRLIAVYRQPLK